ncbi:histidine kinase [Actinomycetes bacterium KLBMP 9797]
MTASMRAPPGAVPLVLVTLGGLTAAAVSVGLAATSDHLSMPGLHAALFNWITLSYLLCGLFAWRRRPDSRLGLLMVAAGFGASLSNLAWANNAAVESVGLAFDLLPVVLFLHAFLAFPDGRLSGRPARVLVAAGYVTTVGGQLAVALLGGFGPDNAFAVADRPGAGARLHDVVLAVTSVLALAGIAVLAARRRTSGRPRRRAVGWLVDAFALGLLMIAVLLLMGLAGVPGFVHVQRLTLVVLGLAPIAFLIGLLDAQLARTGIGDLLVRLRTQPVDLRAELARTLRDPSLSLIYWLPQYASWADEAGQPARLPDGDGARAATVIDRDGEPVAALVHDASLNDERELLDAVSAAAAIALENGRLRVELHARLEEVRGSRARVLEAGQKERQRLERDLHDGAQQRLIALSLDLGRLETRLGADHHARSALSQAKAEITRSLTELRDVARGLHPAVLSGHGLPVALESLVARAAVPVQLTTRLDGRLAEQIEVGAYYVVCEGLANIGKHARASSATVDVCHADGQLVIEVVDDGVGGADTERGSGLRGLADRVEALGGRLRVWTPYGGGTRVRAEIPCG